SWFALKMGAVTVSGALDANLGIELTGTVTVTKLDYNSATGAGRLDWASAFDLDGDGQFDDLINLGALPIDMSASLEYALTGSVTSLSLVAGPLTVTGSSGFALERRTLDVDTDGNGAADLIGATLDALALSGANVTVHITDVANLGVTGNLAIATLSKLGDARSWFALKMGA